MNDIDKIHKILSAKKIKYKFTSLIVAGKSIVVDFNSIEHVPQRYCTNKIIFDRQRSVLSYLPRNIGEAALTSEHSGSNITFYRLKKILIPGNSNFFLTPDKKQIFYEKIHRDDRAIYLYNDENIQFHSNFLAKIKNFPVKKHKVDAVFFGGTFTGNYYHFLIEILSKTEFLYKIPDYEKMKVVLDISIRDNENLKALADFFLIGMEYVFVDNKYYHKFETLWYISSPNSSIPNVIEGTKFESEFTKISPDSIKYLRNVCLRNFDQQKVKISTASKVFIARRSELRKYNESELLEVANKYGFKAVYFEDLNIHEQIFIIQNADLLIGPSGAAWTNLLFAKEGSKGLTWLAKVWRDFSVFSTLASLVGFDLYTIRYDNEGVDFHQDYKLDVQVFEENLQKLVALEN